MTRDEFIAEHPIEQELESRGVKLIGAGAERTAKCPFHKDGSPSLSVNVSKGVWKCFAGCGGGSVIDLIAMFENTSAVDVLREASQASRDRTATQSKWSKPAEPEQSKPDVKATIANVYRYHDAMGEEVFQVVRLIPKSFRQRHMGPDAKWVWNMQGVDRVLYRLPHVLSSQQVVLCEGEKDADTAVSLGLCGTTSVGGAGKWMNGYTESLTGKDVIIMPDNDKPGQDHAKAVFESIAQSAKSVRIVKIPSTFKDLTEYVESFINRDEAATCVNMLISESQPFYKGTEIPLYSMAELEERYKRYSSNSSTEGLNLSRWLPSLGRHVRTLVPGELVLIVGDTGVGKTGLLQTIALHASPMPTVMFEIELPAELLFERFVAAKTRLRASEVERTYAAGDHLGSCALNHYFPNLFICDKAKLTPNDIESIIVKSELKLGVKPKVVLVDYVQLIRGVGDSRYDRASDVAESMKRIAKSTGTVVVIASQRQRPREGESGDVSLHNAKESGSLENSAGLVLGVWRDRDDKSLMHMKVLKNTKGTAGFQLECNFNGEMMIISERAQQTQYDDPN